MLPVAKSVDAPPSGVGSSSPPHAGANAIATSGAKNERTIFMRMILVLRTNVQIVGRSVGGVAVVIGDEQSLMVAIERDAARLVQVDRERRDCTVGRVVIDRARL